MIIKTLFFLMLVNVWIYGCDADCMSCHPSLLKSGELDSEHKILKNCTACHVEKSGEENHGTCGADCFSCHPIDHIQPSNIKEHLILKDCIRCHLSLDKSLFNTVTPPTRKRDFFYKTNLMIFKHKKMRLRFHSHFLAF